MKATTKLQKRVVELSAKLPKISNAQKAWAFEHVLDHFGYFGSKTSICFHCGHKWATDKTVLKTDYVCPSCDKELKAKDSKRRFKDNAYYGILTAKEGFQVIRMFWVEQWVSQSSPAKPWISEVYQLWINPEGQVTIMGRQVNAFSSGYYLDNWRWGSPMEIRQMHRRHEMNPWKWYPRTKVIDIFRRNGFTGDFHGLNPLWLLRSILNNTKSETLLKAGQYSLLDQNIFQRTNIDKYWPSIKICIRNNYIVQNAKDWCDHIDLLKYFNKDVLNAHYVCPANFEEEHQRLVEKKRIILERERAEEERLQLERDHQQIKKRKKKLAKAKKEYLAEKAKFFPLAFSDGQINIAVLASVDEFETEGRELHHCVFANEYYSKPDSLVLSAKKENKRLETIEISLSRMEVVQSRGLQNQPTEYHDHIINLINQNIHQIAKLCG